MIEIPRELFMTAADNAEFYDDNIRTDYNGRGYAANSLGLVGGLEQLLCFFAELGAETMKANALIDIPTVNRLANAMAEDSMGRSDRIFYWAGNVLTLTDEDEDEDEG